MAEGGADGAVGVFIPPKGIDGWRLLTVETGDDWDKGGGCAVVGDGCVLDAG